MLAGPGAVHKTVGSREDVKLDLDYNTIEKLLKSKSVYKQTEGERTTIIYNRYTALQNQELAPL